MDPSESMEALEQTAKAVKRRSGDTTRVLDTVAAVTTALHGLPPAQVGRVLILAAREVHKIAEREASYRANYTKRHR